MFDSTAQSQSYLHLSFEPLTWQSDGRKVCSPHLPSALGNAVEHGIDSDLVAGGIPCRIVPGTGASPGQWHEPLQLAGRLTIERGDARERYLGLIESKGAEGSFDLRADDGGVDLGVRNDPHVRSAFGLSDLVFDDLPVLAER